MATTINAAVQSAARNPDALVTSRASFTAKLIERITRGNELVNRAITNMQELESYGVDFNKWNSYNSEYLKQAFNNESNEYKISYDEAGFAVPDLQGVPSPNDKLKQLKEKIAKKVAFLDQLLESVDLLRSDVEITTPGVNSNVKTDVDKNKVFIVHGHDDTLKLDVARTLEKLGLEAIILHEQANGGMTILEKFEEHSNVGFAVVLLTGDDEGKAKTEMDLKIRARQNVVLELGYFIGKLGRKRICPLYSAGVELPSDVYGLVYVPIDKARAWQWALVAELKKAGYSVDPNPLLK
jgi:predicted nucleotide-binding protein